MIRMTMLVAAPLCGVLFAQSAAPPPPPAAATPAVAGGRVPYRFQPARLSRRADAWYGLLWGVQGLRVKCAESGEMIRFSYTVVDSEKAKQVNDKKLEPLLNDPGAGVQLVVPSFEKVGKFRQTSTPIPGRTYWMAFANPGRRVKRGDHVDVVIGTFRAAGLIVE